MKNKDSRARMQVIFGMLLFAFVMSAELYAMINYPDMYLGIVGLAAVDLVCLYVVINGLFTLREIKDARNEEQYDSVFKSEKASYLMLKKYFEEIEDKLNYLEKAAKVPTEEIVNAQKGIAKVIINRSRENTEALMNSNDQVLEQFAECSDAIGNVTKLLSAYKDEIVSEQKKTEDTNEQSIQVKMQDLVIQMKDMELRLNQAINQIQKVTYQQPVVTAAYEPQAQVSEPKVSAPVEQPQETVVPEVEEEPVSVVEDEVQTDTADIENLDIPDDLDVDASDLGDLDIPDDLDVDASDLGDLDIPDDLDVDASDLGDLDIPDDLDVDVSDLGDLDIPDDLDVDAADLESLDIPDAAEVPQEEPKVEESIVEEVPQEQPAEEEKPPMPDLSDPNKKMSPDEIAALFANMSGDAPKEETKEEPKVEEPVVEEVPQEQPAEEEKPPMPDLSDPNKTLSPDEISALFANMSDDTPKEEEKPVEAEPIVEEIPQEPAEEEKPPMPDLSDPNKTLSPDEIAALFANMQ